MNLLLYLFCDYYWVVYYVLVMESAEVFYEYVVREETETEGKESTNI